MSSAVSARSWPALDWVLGGGVLLACATALPHGLDRVGAASIVAGGATLRAADPDSAARPLALLVVRLFAWLPVGDIATRANLASVALAAVAAALLGRVAADAAASLRPPANARRTERDLFHEPVAAAGGAAVAMLSFGVFLAITSASAVAVTLAITAGAWGRALRLLRAPGSALDGLWLCFLAGLGVGADPAAPLVLWPLALLLWLWALRRGERWTLCGPLVAVAGASIALFAVAASGASGGPGVVAGRIVAAWGSAAHPRVIWTVAREAAAELGVVALLAAVVGLAMLMVRAPFTAALVVATGSLCLLVATAGAGGDRVEHTGAPWALLLAATALPISAGIAQMAGKLGPARVATAAVIAVIAAAWPALDGGGWRWRRDVRLPERLLEQAQAPLAPRAGVDPGSPRMGALFDYGAALGLRPDLQIRDRPDR
jgi:hypothetical protein